MEAFRKYPYFPGQYGIDFSVFNHNSEGEVRIPSGSGADLRGHLVRMSRLNRIRLSVNDENSAETRLMWGELEEGELWFDYKTRSWEGGRLGEPHPDMFARIFVNCFVAWAQNDLNMRVDSWHAMWDPWSINFDQYWTNVEQYKMTRERAAKGTVDGGIIMSNNFKRVVSVNDTGPGVEVYWSR